MLIAQITLTVLVVALLPVCVIRPWIGVLVFAWLGYMNPHRLVGGFAANLPFAKLVAAATLLGVLRSAGTQPLPRTREVYLLAALWITFLCSTMITATHPALARAKLAEVSKILLMTGVTMALFRDRRRLHVLLLVMALSIGCLGFAGGVWALLTRWPTILWGPAESGIGDNNAFGLALTMVLPLLALLRDEEPRRWLRSALLVVFGFSIVAIYATYSRGAFIILLVVLALLVVKRRTRDVALLVAMAAALASSAIAPPQWWARIATITPTAYRDDPSGYHRMRSWYVAFRTGLDHPVLGAGFWPFDVELYQRYLPGYVDFHDAHNHFLQVFAEHGFTGLILFVVLLGSVFLGLRRVMRTTRGDPARRWMAHYADVVEVSLVAYTVGGIFLNMAYFDLMYQLVAVAVILDACRTANHAATQQSGPGEPTPTAGQGCLSDWDFRSDPTGSGPAELTPTAGLKVCLIAPVSPPYGGMSVQAQLLAQRLRGEGVDVHVLATNPELPAGLTWVQAVPGLRTLLREIRFCARLLPAVRRAAVVHHLAASSLYFLLHSAPVILACRLSGTRLVLNYRGGNAPGFLRRYHRLLVPLLRLADAVVVPSGFLERVFRQHGIGVAVLPNVADVEGFTFEPHVPLRPRLIVTRALEPMYNVEGVLRAFRRVQQHYPEAALGIVGAGSQTARLTDLVTEWKLKHVRFYGCVPHAQLAALYREYDVCINASLVDNFPGALVEAACCGLPIVTSDAGGIPDMIQHRTTGMLCPVNDDAQLADRVIEVLRSPGLALQMAGNARRWAEQFAWSRVSPQLLDCYKGPPPYEGGVRGGLEWSVSNLPLAPSFVRRGEPTVRPEEPPFSGGAPSRHIRAGLASAHALLARHVVFPLHEQAKGHVTARMLRDMEVEQWLPAAALQERQAARLRALVAHADDTVPYYRRRFRESALQPRHIQKCEDVSKIPLLSKDDIRNHREEMRSATASRGVRCTTGGSTGAPLAFYLGPTRVSSDVAARCRAEGWWGLGVGELEFVLWASPIESGKQDVLRAARDRLLRTRLFSAFEMNPQTMDRYIAHLLRTPYRRVFGYPGSLALLCERAAATGQRLQRVGVRGVFVTGEYLHDTWRALISNSFGCPVANGYGGRESGFIAHECPAGRMHITADRLIVEIVDAAGNVLDPGESGEIVVTHLDTPEMPLLRYRTGDIGTLAADACPCGRTLPVLARVDGRKLDFVMAPDGHVVHGLSVTYILRDIEGIRQFRVTQKSVDRFDVEIVPAQNYSKRSEAQISDGLSRRLRGAVAVSFTYRDAIPSGPSGKFRHVICEIADASSAIAMTSDP